MSVVNVESLKATSLIHAGKFPKLQNLTTTTSTTEESPSNKTKEAQVEVENEEESPMHNNASTVTKKVSRKVNRLIVKYFEHKYGQMAAVCLTILKCARHL